MTLRHIKIFVTVCEFGSATLAAQHLFLAQPAVSLAISELEGYYGIKLFDRISKRLHITEAGKQFLQYATHIVSLFDQLEKEVRNLDQVGLLRVGASITIGNYLMPNFAQEFLKSHPKMKVNVIIENSESIEQRVLKNEIDFGLIEGITHNSYITSKCFMDDSLVLICSAGHPWTVLGEVELDQLKSENFLIREKGSAGREIFDSLMQIHGLEITPSWQSVSTQAIIRGVSKGLGVSVLPYMLVKENLDSGEIKSIKIKGIPLKRQFSVIYHKNKFLTDTAKDFIGLCFTLNKIYPV